MQEPIFTHRQTEAIKEIMHQALTEYFTSKGRLGKQIIIGSAVLIGSITVILGGFKIILAWFGFSQIIK